MNRLNEQLSDSLIKNTHLNKSAFLNESVKWTTQWFTQRDLNESAFLNELIQWVTHKDTHLN